MKAIKHIFAAVAVGLMVSSCYDMDLSPKGILSEDVLLSSDNGVKKYLALIYQDCPIEDFNYGQGGDVTGYAVSSGQGWHNGNRWDVNKSSAASACFEATGRCSSYGGGWGYWPYDRIREINNFIEKLPNYKAHYTEADYNALLAEARFLRAYYYFGMVKRYGGVPIVDKVLDPKASAEELQQPRNTEYDCWKFIHDDLQFAMENGAGRDKYETGRANKYAAAALMSRAMLYAGCNAKYGGYINVKGKAVSAGLMGMSADKAQEFFQYAYDACKFIKDGGYTLHTGADKEKAYVEVFTNDNKADEDIFVKTYAGNFDNAANAMSYHSWDATILPLGNGLSQQVGACLQPVWELIKLFELPDITDKDGKPVRFDKVEDFWSNGEMEARCRADFFFSGMTEPASGQVMDIQAGVYTEYPGTTADGTQEVANSVSDYTKKYRIQGQNPGEHQTINGKDVKVSGAMGMALGKGDEGYSYTGAIIRKYVDPTAPSGRRLLNRSQQMWKVFRYGEILCNWAEAAYELGLETGNEDLKREAFVHVNELRDRAGAHPHEMVANPKDIGSAVYGFPIDENLQYIRDERARELCFENQHLFDLRRWRVADIKFMDGKYTHAINPYYIISENKWIFLPEVTKEGRKVTFQRAWYYEQIPGGEIGKNPKLIRNDGY